jgi:hypothetical protein
MMRTGARKEGNTVQVLLRVVGVLVSVTALTASNGLAQRGQDWEWQGRVEAGNSIEVKGINGDVRAVASTGNEVQVVAELREHRRGYAEDIEFEVIEHDDGVTICAMYPTPRRADRPNECAPGSRGRMNTRENDVEVNFTVRVPAGVGFTGRTVNGAVDVESLTGDVEAHTVNGDVELSTSGVAQASTVNGSIWASLGRSDWTDALEFETVNGSITLELPDGFGAEVSARTVNGGIETDFPLTVQGRFSSRRLTGTIGEGGRRLWLETVNGSIRLRSR